jgi:molybdate transport system ATP-binding protein
MEGRPTLSDSLLPGSLLPDSLLEVRLKHRVGGVALDVAFRLTQPWTVLFGPSGSGKTTVLRAIAGFVRPHEARITWGPKGEIPVDTQEGIFVPPHLRPVRSAAQTARLFPNATVEQNVAYGMQWGSHPEDEQQVLHEVMEKMRLTTLARRKVDGLSGGERQRVSVARAVAAAIAYDGAGKPLLLLDEPFAGLDSVLRDELVVLLRDWLRQWKVPVLSVSHDAGECFLLDAEVIRIAEGQVVDQGPVEQVLAEERRRMLERLRVRR